MSLLPWPSAPSAPEEICFGFFLILSTVGSASGAFRFIICQVVPYCRREPSESHRQKFENLCVARNEIESCPWLPTLVDINTNSSKNAASDVAQKVKRLWRLNKEIEDALVIREEVAISLLKRFSNNEDILPTSTPLALSSKRQRDTGGLHCCM